MAYPLSILQEEEIYWFHRNIARKIGLITPFPNFPNFPNFETLKNLFLPVQTTGHTVLSKKCFSISWWNTFQEMLCCLSSEKHNSKLLWTKISKNWYIFIFVLCQQVVILVFTYSLVNLCILLTQDCFRVDNDGQSCYLVQYIVQ